MRHLALKTCLTALHAVAVASTVFRLSDRYRTSRLWLDDYVTILPAMMECLYAAVLWLRIQHTKPGQSVQWRVTLYWCSYIAFQTVLWSTRASIALSIARIFPPWDVTRKIAITLACIFGIICLISHIMTSVICNSNISWYKKDEGFLLACTLDPRFGISGLCADIISDSLLVALPLYKLWGVKLPKGQRRLVLVIFSASALTLCAAVVYGLTFFGPLSQLPSSPMLTVTAGHVEAAVSLFACNLMVIVTYIYRASRAHIDRDTNLDPGQTGEDSIPTTNPSTQQPSTTFVLTEIADVFYETFEENSMRNPSHNTLDRAPPCLAGSGSERHEKELSRKPPVSFSAFHSSPIGSS